MCKKAALKTKNFNAKLGRLKKKFEDLANSRAQGNRTPYSTKKSGEGQTMTTGASTRKNKTPTRARATRKPTNQPADGQGSDTSRKPTGKREKKGTKKNQIRRQN